MTANIPEIKKEEANWEGAQCREFFFSLWSFACKS